MKNVKWKHSPGSLTNQQFKDWVNERNARWGLTPPVQKEEEQDGMQQRKQDARGVSTGVVCQESDGIGSKGPEGPETPSRSSERKEDALLFDIPPMQALPSEGTGTVDDGIPQTWEVDEVGV